MSHRFNHVAVILAVVVLVAVPLYAISAHSVAGPQAVTNQAAGCADATFLTAVKTDFGTVSDFMKQVDAEDPAHLVASQVVLSALRQKYEDMSAPTDCFATQLSVIVIAANLSDLITWKLAVVVDAANADTYKKSADTQMQRVSKLVQQFATTVGGGAAATAAASS